MSTSSSASLGFFELRSFPTINMFNLLDNLSNIDCNVWQNLFVLNVPSNNSIGLTLVHSVWHKHSLVNYFFCILILSLWTFVCVVVNSDDLEVGVVYQRTCYKPSHFASDFDWQTRLMIERSIAVKCPDIAYHLAGTKKVQQILAQPGVVEKFMSNADAVCRIRATFAQQLTLDMVSITHTHILIFYPLLSFSLISAA